MERDIFEIVAKKDFIALSPEERIELKDYCSTEEEYNQLKQVLTGVGAIGWTNPQPQVETKERLDVLFAQTHPKVAVPWYNSMLVVLIPKEKPIYRQPLLQIAALALLVFLTVPFLKSGNSETSQVLVADNTSLDKKDFDSEQEMNVEIEGDVDISTSTESEIVESETEVLDLPITREIIKKNVTGGLPVNPSAPVAVAVSNHPDGVFIEEEMVAYSLPASDQPDDVMDLLTSAF